MKIIRWIVTVLYAAGIFYLSSRQWSGMPLFAYSDKVIHFILYAGLAFLCAWSLRVTDGLGHAYMPVLAMGIATAYGAIDEIHQFFVPGRTCELWDLLSDATGAAVGAFLAIQFSRKYQRKRTLQTGSLEDEL